MHASSSSCHEGTSFKLFMCIRFTNTSTTLLYCNKWSFVSIICSIPLPPLSASHSYIFSYYSPMPFYGAPLGKKSIILTTGKFRQGISTHTLEPAIDSIQNVVSSISARTSWCLFRNMSCRCAVRFQKLNLEKSTHSFELGTFNDSLEFESRPGWSLKSRKRWRPSNFYVRSLLGWLRLGWLKIAWITLL